MTEKAVIPVLDFSGIFARERSYFPSSLEDRVRWELTDFRSLGGTMCFCEKESAAKIRKEFSRLPDGPAIHWIDTGDYHYLTYFFLERIGRPFELWLLDNHPDDQESVFGGDLLSCGGWVRTAREQLPNLWNVVWYGGDYRIGEKEDSFAGARNDSHGTRNESKLPVYVSIDKDVMSKDFARTDWSQGEMTLPELLTLLDALRGREVLGVDICGGLSEAKGAEEADTEMNAKTDSLLIDKLLDIIY